MIIVAAIVLRLSDLSFILNFEHYSWSNVGGNSFFVFISGFISSCFLQMSYSNYENKIKFVLSFSHRIFSCWYFSFIGTILIDYFDTGV